MGDLLKGKVAVVTGSGRKPEVTFCHCQERSYEAISSINGSAS